ncbi:MAG: hypothetical protein WB626_12905 [Bacteroidota bacterium]
MIRTQQRFTGIQLNRTAYSDGHLGESIPLCDDCLSKITDLEKETLRGDVGILAGRQKSCRFFSCDIERGCVLFRFNRAVFANALGALNPGLVFSSLEDCLRAELPRSHPFDECDIEGTTGSGVLAGPGLPLPPVNPDSASRYATAFGRGLTPRELALVDAWHTKAAGAATKLFTHPGIPDDKLANAKAAYADVRPGELVVALYDGTLLTGSAKSGFVVSTEALYWGLKLEGTNHAGRAVFAEINPYSVNSDGRTKIFLGDEQFIHFVENQLAMRAVASFIAEAAMIARCRDSAGG